MAQPLFGLVPAGLPVEIQPTETLSPTSFLYTIPPSKPFSHMVIFLLPGITLPPNTAAAIYLVTPPPPGQSTPNSRFLGGVGPGKESAIFKLASHSAQSPQEQTNVVIGISIEEAESVASRIQASKSTADPTSSALVPATGNRGGTPSTAVLAQRIIKNAFNFLASFSGQAGQVEVVPLRAFEDWWRKFESRVRTDPGFLERDD